MRVRVEVLCAPHPAKEIKSALLWAGKKLALRAESVSVRIDPADPRLAILEFEMRRAAQYKVVDRIYDAIRLSAWAFYQEVTIGFPKG
jgi:hypothetical protein